MVEKHLYKYSIYLKFKKKRYQEYSQRKIATDHTQISVTQPNVVILSPKTQRNVEIY